MRVYKVSIIIAIKYSLAKHCWTVIPGPTTSSFGAYEMKVVFRSSHSGTANGFQAVYEIRKAFSEQVPFKEGAEAGHCGHVIKAGPELTSGSFTSPGFGAKYTKDLICDWEIIVQKSHQVRFFLHIIISTVICFLRFCCN